MLTDYEYAVLAMNVYNSRPTPVGANIENYKSGDSGPLAGSVVLGTMIAPAGDPSFAAIAYKIGDDVVIAFRGTNDPGDGADDLETASGLLGQQGVLALDFYDQIQQEVALQYPGATVSFTGHSLGGGLAGIASATTGLHATIFDPMPFDVTVNFLRAGYWLTHGLESPPPVNWGAINSYEISGEFLETARAAEIVALVAARDISTFPNPETIDAMVASGYLPPSPETIYAHVPGLPVLNSNDAHSIYLMAIMQYLGGNGQQIEAALSKITPALFDDVIALSAGIEKLVGSYLPDGSSPSNLAMNAIAYSGANNPDAPAGTTALSSLKSDVYTLNDAMVDGLSDGSANALASYAVLHAEMSAAYSDTTHSNGILSFEASDLLSVDYSDAAWNFADTSVWSDTRSFTGMGHGATLDQADLSILKAGPGHTDRHFYALGVDGYQGTLPSAGSLSFIGTAQSDHVVSGDETDTFSTGGGDDTIRAEAATTGSMEATATTPSCLRRAGLTTRRSRMAASPSSRTGTSIMASTSSPTSRASGFQTGV